MGMLIFAGLGYALEKDEPDTMFYTLPQTLYWAIITMTSTGYGDISPRQILTVTMNLMINIGSELLLASLQHLCVQFVESCASPCPSQSSWQTSTGQIQTNHQHRDLPTSQKQLCFKFLQLMQPHPLPLLFYIIISSHI